MQQRSWTNQTNSQSTRTDTSSPTVVGPWITARNASAFSATHSPSISWQTETDAQSWRQASALVEMSRQGAIEEHVFVGSESVDVPWPFDSLEPYDTAQLRVTVTGLDGIASEPSSWLTVATGPLRPADWSGSFIHLDEPAAHDDDRPTTRFRRDLTVEHHPVRALLSFTAHGIAKFTIDGVAVTTDELAPGWTAYADRLNFSSYDVTHLLAQGRHVLGATVGDGWYGEHYGFDGAFARAWTGPRALIAQLRLEHSDGSIETIVTDESWRATTTGPVTYASIYQGEHYDARLVDTVLADVDADASGWRPVTTDIRPVATLSPAFAPPVRVIETLPASEVLHSPTGATLYDFGQNIAGWVRIRIAAGDPVTVTLRHAEVLENGELGSRPLRFAAATDRIITTTEPVEWRPAFTYHGFRFVEVSGVDASRISLEAEVVHTDMARTGWIETSDDDVNALHANTVWSFRGNAVSLPTDCPQRDERLGWSGDIQVFAPAAAFLFDSNAFLHNWLEDLSADQRRQGGVAPIISPSIGSTFFPSSPIAAWGDAAVLVPWVLWQRFGNRKVLEQHYADMKSWVEVVRGETKDELWERGFQLGDWLDPTAPADNPTQARTDSSIVATAYYFRSTITLSRIAELLGNSTDATHYSRLAEKIRTAFIATYISPRGRMVSDAPTAYALALAFEIVTEDEQRLRLGSRLAEIVRSHGYRIGTGFVGTPIICEALSGSNQRDAAHRLLLERDCPSWMYPITMGATTIWERWDSMLPDGSINPGEMTSFNHYALGAVIDWIHRDIGGISPASAGYAHVLIRPRPGRIASSTSTFHGPYGKIRSAWTVTDGRLELELDVPPNSEATVDLTDDTEPVIVGSGHHRFSASIPRNPRPGPVTPLSSLADVIDDSAARDSFIAYLDAVGYPMVKALSSGGMWRSDWLLRDGLPLLPPTAVPGLLAAVGASTSAPNTIHNPQFNGELL